MVVAVVVVVGAAMITQRDLAARDSGLRQDALGRTNLIEDLGA
jgi:hypothetical protein